VRQALHWDPDHPVCFLIMSGLYIPYIL